MLSIRDQLITLLATRPGPETEHAFLLRHKLSNVTLYQLRHRSKGGLNTRTAERLASALGYEITLTPKEPFNG